MANFLIKRSSVANKRPTPSLLSEGEITINTNSASPGVYFKGSDNSLTKSGPTHVGGNPPNFSPAGYAGNSLGETWLDTSQNILKTYAGDSRGWIGVPVAPTLPFDVLPSTAGVHLYSSQKQITNSSTPVVMSFLTQEGSKNEIPVPAWTNKNWTNALAWISNNSINRSTWWSTVNRWYDQIGSYHLQGSNTETNGPVLIYNGFIGTCGGAYAPTSLNDSYERVMSNGTTTTEQTGTACWVIAVFNGDASRVPTRGYVWEWAPTPNGWQKGTSLYGRLDGTRGTLKVGVGNDLSLIPYNSTNKNVILYCDRGPGTTTQYSVNGGSLTDSVASNNTGYRNGFFALGGSVYNGNPTTDNWNAPISTFAYWIGSPSNMPSNSVLKQISDALWAS